MFTDVSAKINTHICYRWLSLNLFLCFRIICMYIYISHNIAPWKKSATVTALIISFGLCQLVIKYCHTCRGPIWFRFLHLHLSIHVVLLERCMKQNCMQWTLFLVSCSELKTNGFLGYLLVHTHTPQTHTHLCIDAATVGRSLQLDFCPAWQHLHYLHLRAGNVNSLCTHICVYLHKYWGISEECLTEGSGVQL